MASGRLAVILLWLVGAATASLAASAAYALEARKVGGGTAPDLGWLGLANALTSQLWRGSTPRGPTLH